MGQKVCRAPRLFSGKGRLPSAHRAVADNSACSSATFPSRLGHLMGHETALGIDLVFPKRACKETRQVWIVGPKPKTPETMQANLLGPWDTPDPNALCEGEDKTNQMILILSRFWKVCVLQTYPTWRQSWTATGFNDATKQLTTQ